MTTKWSFSYNSFVKFHGKKIWEPHHDLVIFKICVIMSCAIKGLHFIILRLNSKLFHLCLV